MVSTTTLSPYRFVIGGLTVSANLAIGLSFQSVSPILPIIQEDYSINSTNAGLLLAVVMGIQGAGGIPMGIVIGRIGIKASYTISLFLIGSLILAALSPNFPSLLVLRGLYGLGFVTLIAATGPLIMNWFRPRELAAITSINIACFALGVAISLSAAAPLSDVMGWDRTLGLFGAFGLATAFAWMVWGKTRETEVSVTPAPTRSEIWDVLKNRTVLLLGIADGTGFALYLTLSGWLPTYYNESRGMSLTEAGFITSLLPFMGIGGVLLGGFLPLKIGNRRLFLIVPGAMIALGGLGSFLIDIRAVMYLSVSVLGIGSLLYVPTLFTLPMELPGMNPKRVALVWGWIMSARGLVAFVSPLVVGAFKDSLDTFVPGFLIFAMLAWSLCIVGFMLPKTFSRPAPVAI